MSLHEQVKAAQDAWVAAVITNDADVIAQRQAPEWMVVTSCGPVSREDFLGAVRGGHLTHSSMAHASEPQITVSGDIAVVSVRVLSTENGAENDEWTTNVFVLREGQWLVLRTHVTPTDSTGLM